jgi:hypothetical protein
MTFALWIVGALALAVIAGVFAVLFWLRYSLLNGVAGVDEKDVDPVLLREIERLEMDYAIADELGYGGDVLLGIESKLNAAKLRAAAGGAPEASLTWVVAASILPEQAFMPALSIVSLPVPQLTFSFIQAPPMHLDVTGA